MVNVPERAVVLVLGSTVKLTVPLPVPFLPLLMVIKLELLTDFQAQLFGVVTLNIPLPPAALKDCAVGVMV